MTNSTTKERYHIPTISEIKNILESLGYSQEYIDHFIRQIKHFEDEAPRRDEIVESYLSKEEIETIVKEIVEEIDIAKKEQIYILDVGAGSGYFTTKIKQKLKEKGAENICIYGLDITPSMLRKLAEKEIIPLWGIAENLAECIKKTTSKQKIEIPEKFDYIISILAFHHFLDLEKVLTNIKEIIKQNGKVIIIDILKYQNEELMKKLEDPKPGLDPKELEIVARKIFKNTKMKLLENVDCCAENVTVNLFKAVFKL